MNRLLPALLLLCLGLGVSAKRPERAPQVDVRLNDAVTNSLSEIPELRPMDQKIDSFMRFWEIKGASLAIMRNDSLVYAKGYGWADRERGVRMQPGNLLRMASVSKLITAVGIMVLQERGLLWLGQPVFGPFGILNEYDAFISDEDYYLITVENLLRHEGGFSTNGGDPKFSTLNIMRQYGFRRPPSQEQLVEKLLSRPLHFVPGEGRSYSNFGYLLLSMIIEKVSGEPYERFIQEQVLRRAGCLDFHIARIYYEDRWPGEVKYYGHKEEKPVSEYNGSGRQVVRAYGGNDLPTLSGAGAWVGSTVELARLVGAIDQKFNVPDIISPFSIWQMTQQISDDGYPLGWMDVRQTGEWTRTGSLSGTSALVKYYPDGECWIFITNTSTWKGSRFTKDTAGLFEYLRRDFSAFLPERDLFEISF